MPNIADQFLGVGIYTVSDAARLTAIPQARIRRWIRGYKYRYAGQNRTSPPVWEGQLRPLDSTVALGFLDLMELRFVDAFLRAGVSLQSTRKAVEKARRVFKVRYPFCTQRFKTDGRTIFIEVGNEIEEKALLDLVKDQYAFEKILRPYMAGLEYVQDGLVRWWPLGARRSVVLDPNRSFGKPIIAKRGVPTSIIYKAVQRESAVEPAMRWFEVKRHEVLDAVKYERSLAA